MDLEQIIEQYDFHIFFMERRDGSHFAGNVYKTKHKALSVGHTYMKNNPMLFKGMFVLKVGDTYTDAEWYHNPEYIDDGIKANQFTADRERRAVEEIQDELLEYFKLYK